MSLIFGRDPRGVSFDKVAQKSKNRPLGDLTSDELISRRETLTSDISKEEQARSANAPFNKKRLNTSIFQLAALDKFAPSLSPAGSKNAQIPGGNVFNQRFKRTLGR